MLSNEVIARSNITLRCIQQYRDWNKSESEVTGELFGVVCEDMGESWPRYNGSAPYLAYDIKDKHLRLLGSILPMQIM